MNRHSKKSQYIVCHISMSFVIVRPITTRS